MSIYDIIEDQEPALDQYLWEELYRKGGEDLVGQGLAVFKDEDAVREWFYEDNYALGGTSPYEMCLEKKHDEVMNLLRNIEYSMPV